MLLAAEYQARTKAGAQRNASQRAVYMTPVSHLIGWMTANITFVSLYSGQAASMLTDTSRNWS